MTATRRFVLALSAFSLVVLAGTVGYVLLEHWPLREALYMTVITVTTVGFNEVRNLTPTGEVFTIGLIVLGVVSASVAVTSLAAVLVSGDIRAELRGRRMQQQIERLRRHYIICGYGVVGREVAQDFATAGVPFVVIEREIEHLDRPPPPDWLVVAGDASDDTVLLFAGIEQARGLVAAVHGDADNVLVCLTARQLNPKLTIVARATEEGAERKLRRAGANHVVSPYQIAGRRMATAILRPSVIDFLDNVVGRTGQDLQLEQVVIGPKSKMIGASLKDTGVGQTTGAIILAITRADGVLRGPEEHARLAATVLNAGDQLMALGSPAQLQRLRLLAHHEESA